MYFTIKCFCVSVEINQARHKDTYLPNLITKMSMLQRNDDHKEKVQ